MCVHMHRNNIQNFEKPPSPRCWHAQNATETLLRAHYNLLLKGEIPTPSAEWFAEQLAAARSLKNPSDDLSYLLGYFEWMLEGKRDAWHNLVANNSPTQTTHSLAALCYTGGLFPHELLLIEALPMEERPIAILVALSALGDKSAAPALRGKIGPQAAQETVSAYRKLFDRAGFPALNKPHAR